MVTTGAIATVLPYSARGILGAARGSVISWCPPFASAPCSRPSGRRTEWCGSAFPRVIPCQAPGSCGYGHANFGRCTRS